MKTNSPITLKQKLSIILTVLFVFLSPSYSWAGLIDIRVTVACDEEWINIYEEHWQQAALNVIEEADKELIKQFGINLLVDENSFVRWQSNLAEFNLADLLREVNRDVGILEEDDILLAFTGKKTDYVGMAYVNGYAGIVMHQNPLYDAIVTRHEVSHILGCLDEDPPIKSVMAEWWDYPDRWSKKCQETIITNRERFRN